MQPNAQMHHLERLSFGFLVVSGLIHLYVLIGAMLGRSPYVPSVFWSLHIGVLVIGPALYWRFKGIQGRTGASSVLQIFPAKAKQMGRGVSRYPLYALWALFIGVVFLVPPDRNPMIASEEPWFAFSVIWIGFYYVSWGMLRDERRQPAAA